MVLPDIVENKNEKIQILMRVYCKIFTGELGDEGNMLPQSSSNLQGKWANNHHLRILDPPQI